MATASPTSACHSGGIPAWFPCSTSIKGNGTFKAFSSAVLQATYPTFAFLDANRDGRVDIFSTKKGGSSEEHYLALHSAPTVKPKPKPKPKCKPKPPHKHCK